MKRPHSAYGRSFGGNIGDMRMIGKHATASRSQQRLPPLSRMAIVGCYRLFQSTPLDCVDLQRDEPRIDPALRERTAGKPKSRLAGAGPHIAKLLLVGIKTPYRSDALSHFRAEE